MCDHYNVVSHLALPLHANIQLCVRGDSGSGLCDHIVTFYYLGCRGLLHLLSLSLVLCEGPQAVQELWGIIADKLLEAIHLEPDVEIIAIMMDSLCKVRCSFIHDKLRD